MIRDIVLHRLRAGNQRCVGVQTSADGSARRAERKRDLGNSKLLYVLNRIVVVDASCPRPNKATYPPGKQKLDAVDDRTLTFSVRPKQDEALPFEI